MNAGYQKFYYLMIDDRFEESLILESLQTDLLKDGSCSFLLSNLIAKEYKK